VKSAAGRKGDGKCPRAPLFFELGGDYIGPDVAVGQRSWNIRAQNLCVVVSWLAEGEKLQDEASPDEHAILVLGDTSLHVESESGDAQLATGPSLVIVPAGAASAVANSPGWVARIFTARAGAVVEQAINTEDYETANPAVAGLPDLPADAGKGSIRVHSADAVGDQIFRTDSLLLKWFADSSGEDETSGLAPLVEDDLERVSITIDGDHVHHVRRPWSADLEDWRADEHVQCTSPSISVIPPGNINLTRAVGGGVHTRIDVFAPVRAENGSIANGSDYARATASSAS